MLSVLKTNFKIDHLKIILCLILGCLALLIADNAMAGDRVLFKGIVSAYKLNIRTSPSQDSDVVVVVKKGVQVDVVEKKGGIGGWLTVVYQGQKGYIRNRTKYIILKAVKAVQNLPAVKPPPVVKIPRVVKSPAAVKKPVEITPEKAIIREKIVIKEKIISEEEKFETFSKNEIEVIEGLNEIDYGLNQARLKSRRLSRETSSLEMKIKKIRESKESLAAQTDTDKVYAGQRLNALYRMRMIGRLDIAGVPASVFDFFLSQNAMKQVVQSDLQVLETQANDFKKLSSLETEFGQQVAVQNDLEAELSLQIRIKEKETLKKAAILSEIQREKNLSQAALQSLKASARDLDNKLRLMDSQGGNSVDDSSFLRQKGRLHIPVQGKIVSRFGRSKTGDYKSFTFQSGIDIKVERGEPVRSVFKGDVMFAQWLKGYGNLVIINHGDNYYTLYAHVEEIFIKRGETVDTGEVIATAGDTGSIKGLRLHFEVRHHGKPVNPMKWIRKGV